MNEINSQKLRELYQIFESGDRAEALARLQEFVREIEDPQGRAELLYHEALWLLELDRVPEARTYFEKFKDAATPLLAPSVDDCRDDDASTNLAVMISYAQMKVLLAEKRELEALKTLKDLLSRYPKRLSMADVQETYNEIQSIHGMILGDLNRWDEAEPLLAKVIPPAAWRGLIAFYLGQCYLSQGKNPDAKRELVNALKVGLRGGWEGKAHYALGIVLYNLGDVKSAKHEFEMSLQTADSEYLGKTRIWEWLEATANAMGMPSVASQYRDRKLPPNPNCKPN